MEVLNKLKIELPYNPAILLLSIYPDKSIIRKDKKRKKRKKRKFLSTNKQKKKKKRKDTCTPMFIAAQFVIAKTWKQPKCP